MAGPSDSRPSLQHYPVMRALSLSLSLSLPFSLQADIGFLSSVTFGNYKAFLVWLFSLSTFFSS